MKYMGIEPAKPRIAVVDFTCCVLRQQAMSLEEAQRHIGGVKKMALRLFPDKEQTFDFTLSTTF